MKLRTMELMGWDDDMILRHLKIELKEAKGRVNQLDRCLKIGIDQRAFTRNYEGAVATVTELEDEIAKRELPK